MPSFSTIFTREQNNQASFNNNAATFSSRKRFSLFGSMNEKQRKLLRRSLLMASFVLLIGILVVIINAKSSNSSSIAGVSTTNGSGSSTQISQSYTFNARDNQGRLLDKKTIKMTIQSAQLQKQILIQGQPATARTGKTFLIFSIDLENTYTDRAYLPVNQLIRWQDGNKLRAPDVHNDLVLIDPISTKSTRVGYLVNDNQHEFTIKVGEVDGPKQTINLKM